MQSRSQDAAKSRYKRGFGDGSTTAGSEGESRWGTGIEAQKYRDNRGK